MNAYFGLTAHSPQKLVAGAFTERVDKMSVPGATTSGLTRRSWHGPRLEKPASRCASPLTSASPTPPGGKSAADHVVHERPALAPSARSLHAAPTVSTFFAVAGARSENRSGKPGGALSGAAAVASLPAATTTKASGCSHTNESTSRESARYSEPATAPQLWLRTRAPSAYASASRSYTPALRPPRRPRP